MKKYSRKTPHQVFYAAPINGAHFHSDNLCIVGRALAARLAQHDDDHRAITADYINSVGIAPCPYVEHRGHGAYDLCGGKDKCLHHTLIGDRKATEQAQIDWGTRLPWALRK